MVKISVESAAIEKTVILTPAHATLAFEEPRVGQTEICPPQFMLLTDLLSLKINCNHATQRRGGFSPPGPAIEALGGENPPLRCCCN